MSRAPCRASSARTRAPARPRGGANPLVRVKEVRLEGQATVPTRVPEQDVRIVTENCYTF